MRTLKKFAVQFNRSDLNGADLVITSSTLEVDAMNIESAIKKVQKIHKKDTNASTSFKDYTATQVVKLGG